MGGGGRYPENKLRSIIPKGQYSESRIRGVSPRIGLFSPKKTSILRGKQAKECGEEENKHIFKNEKKKERKKKMKMEYKNDERATNIN